MMLDPKLTITVSGEPGLGAAPLGQYLADMLRERGVTPAGVKYRSTNVFTVDALEVHVLLGARVRKWSAVVVVKDGHTWDTAPFDPERRETMGVAMEDALAWQAKILREEPEAAVRIEVRP
jgi:hypothetical protein